MLLIIWKGTAPEDKIKEVEARILEMAAKYSCLSIVNDVQAFFIASTAILAGLTQKERNSKALHKLGVKYIAHVLHPESVLPEPRQQWTNAPEENFFSHKMDAVEWIAKKIKRQVFLPGRNN